MNLDQQRECDDMRRWEALKRTCCYSPEIVEVEYCSETGRECHPWECSFKDKDNGDCVFLVLRDKCNNCGTEA